MEEQQIESRIRQTVEDLFQRSGFSFSQLSIEKHEGEQDQLLFLVKIKSEDDCSVLLDDKGKNLRALEHLARLLIAKELNQKISLILDLNNFLEKRNSRILELAKLVAEKVQATQKSYILRPMSAYERRLVHMELANWPNVITESTGEEPRRRVVIKPL